MFAVGRIGSYISRGVYTVSGPFHPFGGAVDIIVVEQQDGSYKSTPWYVRFGKFQGVLKATERIVSINVNGVDANFHMYLDRQGEAFFLREVDTAEGESESYPYSADEMEVKPDAWGAKKSMSCNYEVDKTKAVPEREGSNRKSLTRNNSRREKIFGLPFGRRSMKENGFQNREASVEVDSISSLERAEIAADLLEVRWSTNLHTGKNQNRSASDEVKLNSSISTNGETQHACSINPDNSMEFTLEKAYVESDSHGVDNSSNNDKQTARNETSEVSQLVDLVKIEGGASSVEAPLDNESDTLENIASSVGNKEVSNAAEFKFGDELNTTQCSIDKVLIGEVIVKKDGEGLCMEDSTTDNHFQSLTRLLDESSSDELSAGTSYMNSLHSVSEKECAIANVSRSSLSSSEPDRNNIVTSSDVLKEEQFLFSDLDDSEVEKGDHTRNLSSGSEECLSQGSLESKEVAVSDTIISSDSHEMTIQPTQDNPLIKHPSIKNNSKRVSSPMSISMQQNNADEETLAPVAESLPNMVLNGDNVPINVSQPLGHSLDSTLDAFRMVSNDVPVASTSSARQEQVVHSQLTADDSQLPMEIKKIISDPAVEVSLCRHLLIEGMGYEAAARAFDSEKLDIDNFLSLGPEVLGNDKLVVRIGGLYFPWDAAMPIVSAIGSQGNEQVLELKGMIAVGQVDNDTSDMDAQNSINSQNGSWKIWPFSFKRSNSSSQHRNSSSEAAAESPGDMVGNNGAAVPRVAKKKMRTKMPTSEQLASLNLKEGKNVVTFTFSTAMLGEQQVDARIFLWKWNARIVISDVDGTITKSDVLGQFMPMMGMDWSHTGVTHLFSAIKENGYQLVFLSARSISQAYHTRQFLINLKQDGKALPEGPVLISPDGLFPSLYREVIRRAPHEFKIACLEDVKVLFSPDHNPFYAGFGNRDTDELSYLKMGIPKGKIFTINPKGQVVVNRRMDSKSYTSLHALVHDMFPPTTMHEQEDYNSWNFWRLPPPDGVI